MLRHRIEPVQARRRRGAAFAEAVIMLPVFIVTFWGYYYLGNGFHARNQAFAQARMEAWNEAKEGCPMIGGGEGSCPDCGSVGGGDYRADGVLDEATGDASWITSIIGGLFGPVRGGRGEVSYSSFGVGEAAAGETNSDRRSSAATTIGIICTLERQQLGEILKDAVCSIDAISALVSLFSADWCR